MADLVFRDRRGPVSWGRTGRGPERLALPAFAGDLEAWSAGDRDPRLAVGLRRSYGDTCAFGDGRVIQMTGLDRIRSFDPATGVIRAQAGLSLDALLRVCVPRGWFAPVTPGTRRVTLGGAVANDVHGKNHTAAGTFGRHVIGLTLLRSDRGCVEVGPSLEPELFAATIGGLGLTGVILEVALQLTPIRSSRLVSETLPMGDLQDFFAINDDSVGRCEFTVAWVDCTRRGGKIGWGVYSRADWADDGVLQPHQDARIATPLDAPGFAINPLTLALFNRAYRAAQLAPPRRRLTPYAGVFHPLDAVQDWNRLYGPRGFYQYQCVVPRAAGRDALAALLGIVGASGQGSPLVVLKTFGSVPSPGLMSFPRPGYTLALDFANRGEPTLALMARLDQVVRAAGGALYPAKDGRMPRDMFEDAYPHLPRLLAARDPACGSDFLQRMGLS
jgi:L-gulonolactone oxidase